MGIRVRQCSVKKGVEFFLPLKPNRNHKNTAFGGTLVAAQALASWAWLMALLAEHRVQAEVVLQRQMGEFLRPVSQDFRVYTRVPAHGDIEKFLKTLKKHKKARLVIEAWVECQKEKRACLYVGEYVALR